ncbi:hypothetical protein Taro_026933 [Colocasia esculenta]|uniref:Uncharacterized protein n=1 Tax=Colocasia esculenta TaxID=4460 RepID=A0A843VQ50_COLES|nr:hypothetical protein [Colocasia esculenta]
MHNLRSGNWVEEAQGEQDRGGELFLPPKRFLEGSWRFSSWLDGQLEGIYTLMCPKVPLGFVGT